MCPTARATNEKAEALSETDDDAIVRSDKIMIDWKLVLVSKWI